MAKLILKVNYYKPGRSKSMGGYAKYIATRENVEKNEDKEVCKLLLGYDSTYTKGVDVFATKEELVESLLKE